MNGCMHTYICCINMCFAFVWTFTHIHTQICWFQSCLADKFIHTYMHACIHACINKYIHNIRKYTCTHKYVGFNHA